MKLILCDNKDLKINKHPNDVVIIPNSDIKPCIGCFSCWHKTPGTCIYNDSGNLRNLLLSCDELIIISKNTYGGLSPLIKRSLDRSISFVLPSFEKRNNLTRHQRRYDNNLNVFVYLYGDITDDEKNTAKNILASTCENLGGNFKEITFFNELSEVTL